MSKKCCGFIYSDEDQICRICGKPLVDDEFMGGGAGRMSDMDLLLSSLADRTQDYDEASYQDNDEQYDEYSYQDNDEQYDEYLYQDNGNELYDDVHNIEDADMEQDTYEDISEYPEDVPEDGMETATELPDELEQMAQVYEPNEKNKMDVLDEIEAEEQAAEEAKIKPGEEKAPTSIKVVGILSMVLAGMALVMSGVFVYFMVIKPSYDKEGESMKPIYFPEIATSSDINLSDSRGYISNVPLATSTDYIVYEPVEPESSETDSPEADATATDADDAPEADVVE